MRFLLLSVFVFFFVVLPMYALNALLMPELQSLQQTYSTAGERAAQIANPPVAQ